MTMTDSYAPVPPNGFAPPATASDDDQQGKVDTAKQEAANLKDTATEQAGNVAGTAKDEAKNVAHEAKSQAKDLYAQTQSELKEQAGAQQQRVASGLRSLGDELGSMASGSEQQGLASDLVRQVADRAGSAASWLDARDPGSLLNEVKSYARRKPGTFIAAAAIAGVVAGRLTRALAGNAADEKVAEASAPATPSTATSTTTPAPAVSTPVPATAPVPPVVDTPTTTPGLVEDTPVYNQRAATLGDDGYTLPGDEYPR
jgi:hypothetical protein